MASALAEMKRLHGPAWPEVSKPYRAVLAGVMGEEGCGPLEAVIPIAKAMSAKGVSPIMVLAVAAEMCEQPKGPPHA